LPFIALSSPLFEAHARSIRRPTVMTIRNKRRASMCASTLGLLRHSTNTFFKGGEGLQAKKAKREPRRRRRRQSSPGEPDVITPDSGEDVGHQESQYASSDSGNKAVCLGTCPDLTVTKGSSSPGPREPFGTHPAGRRMTTPQSSKILCGQRRQNYWSH
jgi:hypothetical protein